MSFDVVTADLESFDQAQEGKPYSSRAHIAEKDIERWSALIGEPRAALYDQIAIYLARRFQSSKLSFEFCDAIINDICGLITSANEDRPDLFREVYLAFDEGEYYHEGRPDDDPVELYTRPLITRFLENRSSP